MEEIYDDPPGPDYSPSPVVYAPHSPSLATPPPSPPPSPPLPPPATPSPPPTPLPSPPPSPPLPPMPSPTAFCQPPPPLPRRQPILIYSQLHHPTEYQPTRLFYDPNTLYNEFAFTLEGNTEYIIFIQGVGFEYNDNYIFNGYISGSPTGPLEVDPDEPPRSICLLIRHLGPEVNLSVAPRTSLAFLLENARVSLRMCSISQDAEFYLRNDAGTIVTGALAPPRSNYLTTYSPYLRTTPTVSQQAASRHPLLLRRLINLPKRGPSPLALLPNSE